MTQEELNIIEAAIAGKEGAFEALFDYYYHMAYAFAVSYTKNDADAKDAVQEAFITIHTSIKDLREPITFPAWLKKVVHSKCYKIFRKKHEIPSDPEIINESQCMEQRSYMIPFDHYNNENEKDVIHHLIRQLKPKYQDVVELFYLKQLKIEEVAQIVGLSHGTVKTRLHRAKKDLSVLVKQFEEENGRKINFRSDMLAADSLMVVMLCNIKQYLTKAKHFIASNVMISASAAVMGGLLVSGGVMMADDLRNEEPKQEEPAMATQPPSAMMNEINPTVFESTIYQDQTIDNSRTAYFTCLNYIYNHRDHQNEDETDFKEIKAAYESLKQKNDAYYQKLVEEGLYTVFE